MIDDDWKGEAGLKGIKRPKGEGNGYNLKRRSLEARIDDAKLKAALKPGQYQCERCGRVAWGGDHVCSGSPA